MGALTYVMGFSLLANAALGWWGLHEYRAAAVAEQHARTEIAQATANAESSARAAQKAADDQTLAAAENRARQALDAVAAAKDIAGAARQQADTLTHRITELQAHAKPTDCIAQPLPAGVRSLLDSAPTAQ